MDDQGLGNEVLKVVVVALMLGLEVTLYRVCVGGASTKAESSGHLRSHVVPYIFSKGHWFTWVHLSTHGGVSNRRGTRLHQNFLPLSLRPILLPGFHFEFWKGREGTRLFHIFLCITHPLTLCHGSVLFRCQSF